MGLVMWYGTLATTSYGAWIRSTRSWSRASPSTSRSDPRPPARVRLNASRARPRARGPAPPRSPRRPPRAGRRSGSRDPGPISRIRRPGLRSRLDRGCDSSTSGSARKFWESEWRARSPAPRSGGGRPADRERLQPVEGRSIGRATAGACRDPAHRAGQWQRRPRVEVQAGPESRCEPPCRRRPDHGPVVGAQPRPRDDERDARAPPAPAARSRPAARGWRPRRRPGPRPRAPTSWRRPAASWSTRTSTTESWKPQASSATRRPAAAALGSSAGAPRLPPRSTMPPRGGLEPARS